MQHDEGPYRVVIAHRDGWVRRPLGAALRTSRHVRVVAEVTTSTGVLDAVRRHRPDAVVLGVVFGGVNAFQLAPAIREESPGTTVMVLSVAPSERSTHALLDGADLCESVERHPRALAARLVQHLAGIRSDGPDAPAPVEVAAGLSTCRATAVPQRWAGIATE